MTHEELIEKVAKSMFDGERGFATEAGFKNQIQPIRDRYCSYAIAAISTILTALQEPTEEMLVAGCKEDDILGELVDWRGDRCTTREAIRNVFLASINASPLAGEKRGAE